MKPLKLLSLLLVITTILTTLPVSAYELDANGDSIESITYQNSEDEDFSNETSVLAEIGSQYKVTMPKFIVLSGKNKTANYKVSVEGDIAGNEIVYVTPDEYVNLYSKNKNMQIGSIDQDKIAWKYDNFDVDANGNIIAKLITAGKWSGIFNFNIELASTPKQYVLSDIIIPSIDEETILPNLSLKTGTTETIKFTDEDLDRLLGMTSSDENVVAIEETKLIAKNPGTATITTEFIDKDLTFDVTVTENKSSLVHKHTADTAVIENEVESTCTSNGSYDEVIYCSACNEELSRTTHIQKALGHNYKDNVCTRCGSLEISKFKQTYHINGQSYEIMVPWEEDALTYMDGSEYAPSGYTFIGWRTDNTANESVLDKLTVKKENDLYAVYKKTITVTLQGGSSVISNTGTQYINNGNILNPSITLGTSAINGWDLLGYRTDTQATSAVSYKANTAYTFDKNTTLYAVFNRTLTLSYNSNGGTNTPASQTGKQCYNNGNYTNPSFKLAGAIARGNSTDANGNEYTNTFNKWDKGNAGATITIKENTIATAQWSSTYVRKWLIKSGKIMSGVSVLVTGRDNSATYPSSGNGYVTCTLTYTHDTIKFNIQPSNSYANKTLYLKTSYSGGTYNGMFYGACSPWGTGYPSFGTLNVISNNGSTTSIATNSFANGWYLAITAGIMNGNSANCYIYDLYIQ